MKFWMIANVTDEPGLACRPPAQGRGDGILPRERAPRVIYRDRGAAEAELVRRHQAHRRQTFVLLESVAACEHHLIPHQTFEVVRIALGEERHD